MDKLSQQFYAEDGALLLRKVGKGYEFKTVEIDGKRFWMRWLYEKNAANGIEMKGRVDFVEVVPFTEFRLGSTFEYLLKMKYR